MKILCELLGHKMSRHEGTGISPKSLKRIHRIVYICDRCGLREQHDEVISDFDLKDGVNLWGSGGVCMGCKKQATCDSSSSNIMMGRYFAQQVLGGFCYSHCPIHEFDMVDAEKHRLEEWGETLID